MPHCQHQTGQRPGRQRMVWAGTAVAAFLALGMSPSTSVPAARADVGLDLLMDVVNSAPTGLDAGVSTNGFGGWLSFHTWDQPTIAPFEAGLGSVQFGGVSGGFEVVFNGLIYMPLHTAIEDMLHSPLGQVVAGLVNTISGHYLIGDGADGTLKHPDGGEAGLLFGDGGNGFGYSGNGGNAGWLFGNGGNAGSAANTGEIGIHAPPRAFSAEAADGHVTGTQSPIDGAPGKGGHSAALFGNGGNGTDGGGGQFGGDGGDGGAGGNGGYLFGNGGTGAPVATAATRR